MTTENAATLQVLYRLKRRLGKERRTSERERDASFEGSKGWSRYAGRAVAYRHALACIDDEIRKLKGQQS